MLAVASLPMSSLTLTQLQRRFLEIAPRIAVHARCVFRHLACRHHQEDAVAETLALCWQWFVRLAQRGQDAGCFAGTLASLAARAVRSGRRLSGSTKTTEVLSPWSQRRHGYTVSRLPQRSTHPLFAEALRDNTRTAVPEQAAFRVDFPAWLQSHCPRDRALVHDMARGEGTNALARKFGVSPGRISQKRRQLHHDWRRFQGELNAAAAAPATAG